MSKTLALKEQRIEVRTNKEVKSFIQRAAESLGMTLSAFVSQQSYEAAKRVLAEHEALILRDKDRVLFFEALNAPPKPNKALKDLLKKASPKK